MSLPRLRRRRDFVRLARRGRSSAQPGLVLQTTPSGHDAGEGIRFGLTASRKVGNAVLRNRARRRLRALANDLLPTWAKEGCDYVLIARAGTVNRPWSGLRRDLGRALRRTGTDRAGTDPAESGP